MDKFIPASILVLSGLGNIHKLNNQLGLYHIHGTLLQSYQQLHMAMLQLKIL
jgi:hypothetical protein